MSTLSDGVVCVLASHEVWQRIAESKRRKRREKEHLL